MSEEGRDVKAAEEFLKIFEEEEKLQKELAQLFLKGFLKRYHWTKREILSYVPGQRNPLNSPVNMVKKLLREEGSVPGFLAIAQSETEKTTAKAYALGKALGSFLGAFEFGLTHPSFGTAMSRNLTISDRIIDSCKRIAAQLQTMGKQVKPKFIARRLQKIAREHAGNLSPQQQDLLAKIAAIFAQA